MTTPYDDLDIAMRRRNWGWWGEPWPSGICYDDDRLREDMRTSFPVDEDCLFCGEPLTEGDSGGSMPSLFADGAWLVRHFHKECGLRDALGTVECMRGDHSHNTGRTYRQEALEVWAMQGRV